MPEKRQRPTFGDDALKSKSESFLVRSTSYLQRYFFSFRGRAGRWGFVFWSICFIVFGVWLDDLARRAISILHSAEYSRVLVLVVAVSLGIENVIAGWTFLAALVKRLHDFGYSGWWAVFFILDPILVLIGLRSGDSPLAAINAIAFPCFLIWIGVSWFLLFVDGDPLDNKYGPAIRYISKRRWFS
jgi:uncharacterized membrane protein YhaH (DUF805 family)